MFFSLIRINFFEPIFLNEVVGVEVGVFTRTNFLLPNFLKAAEFRSGVKIFDFVFTVAVEEGTFSFSQGDSLAVEDGSEAVRDEAVCS